MLLLMRRQKGIVVANRDESAGFTLIELIAVIVILSILATIGTGFVVKTMESYQRTQTRALIVNTSRQALERMTRQLRIALPYSVRITNTGSCVEFMPIAAGGNYFSPVPDAKNSAVATATIDASPVVVDFGTPRYVSIGAMSSDEIYGASPASRANYASGNLVLTTAKTWQRNSINKRYYLLDNPQAFCVVGDELRFYDGIDVTAANVDLAGGFSIVARNVAVENPASPQPFSLQMGSENRNTRINITLKFSNAGESIVYSQGVLIRNVP
ncbi:prepilin-type N-terminal cleavage/methylation domain-containing protein [Cellvibrio sp. OA-2007]|uniref:prepilin-type N-terminal cleavage/methylation domain-containing protein n=1 Tax=Cellvibrio sp. OA-2007 TaxID=529823 RepID=UPI000B2606A5